MVDGTERMYTDTKIVRDNHALHVRDYAGAGSSFVLLHGFPDNLHIYDLLAPLLQSRGHRVVSFDFLGFGASDKPEGYRYSFDQQKDDVLAVMNGLDLGKVTLVGHDAGGSVALNFALDHPDRIARVGLMNSFFASSPVVKLPELIALFAEPSLHKLAMAFLADPKQLVWLLDLQNKGFQVRMSEAQKRSFDEILQPIVRTNFSQQPSAGPAFAQMTAQVHREMAASSQRLDELAKASFPVQLIWGDKDPYLDRDVAQLIASQCGNAEVSFVDAGHWPQIDAPDEVARLLLGNGESATEIV